MASNFAVTSMLLIHDRTTKFTFVPEMPNTMGSLITYFNQAISPGTILSQKFDPSIISFRSLNGLFTEPQKRIEKLFEKTFSSFKIGSIVAQSPQGEVTFTFLAKKEPAFISQDEENHKYLTLRLEYPVLNKKVSMDIELPYGEKSGQANLEELARKIEDSSFIDRETLSTYYTLYQKYERAIPLAWDFVDLINSFRPGLLVALKESPKGTPPQISYTKGTCTLKHHLFPQLGRISYGTLTFGGHTFTIICSNVRKEMNAQMVDAINSLSPEKQEALAQKIEKGEISHGWYLYTYVTDNKLYVCDMEITSK